MEKFKALGLSETTLSALEKKGFEEPTPIQAQTIPLLLSGQRDIVGQAQTGTGKTAAFGLPLIELLDDSNKKVQALILAPTRELAIQVAEEINSFRGEKKLFVLPVYGGQSYELQIRGLKRGTQIVVGTPGRIRDHIEKRTLDLSHVTHVVLDEADEMLNMGFQEEVEEILKSVPQERRMLLFSATMPSAILKLAKRFMHEYDLIEVKKEQLTTPLTEQIYFEVKDHERFDALCRIIDVQPQFYGIVFCRTKVETDDVARRLGDRGYDADPIHGDITQAQREKVLRAFKTKKTRILVATDVAARGIDVNDLTHVVNFHLPQDPEAYVHRIGRTGRAGKEGTAITFISPSELRGLLFIQKIAKAKIKKEKLPNAKQVVETKREKMKSELRSLLNESNFESYSELAGELMNEGANAQNLIAALLQYSFGDELKEDNYRELQEFNSSVDMKGITRLFVAKGKMDGMNAKSLVDFLSQESGIEPSQIKDVQVLEKFSFINVPFLEAEQLLAVFEKNKRSHKSLITRAKEKENGGFGGGGRREGKFEKRRSDKPEFGNRKREFASGSDKPEFSKRKRDFSSGSDKTEFGNRKKEFSSAAPEKKRRENKNVDYLDSAPKREPRPKKEVRKEDSKPKSSFSFSDDDLSW
ncbi:MAG TPA: DEAD/DEAH box helicase [Chitinophagales bacterium]|nr:DEAD/DEAH box helicase [Chitinophagales bacterium]